MWIHYPYVALGNCNDRCAADQNTLFCEGKNHNNKCDSVPIVTCQWVIGFSLLSSLF